jgi:hypothetical protein
MVPNLAGTDQPPQNKTCSAATGCRMCAPDDTLEDS